MSSTCTGEKTIGFYNRNTREIMYPELVKSDSDIDAFYEKYGFTRIGTGYHPWGETSGVFRAKL